MVIEKLRKSKENFIVSPYSLDELKKTLLAFSEISIEALEQKLSNDYYKDYFKNVGAKTFIIEKEYISRDYLDDFSNYYVRCFKPYKRFCTRLHFFDCSFSSRKFNNIISGNLKNLESSITELQKSYLGYIVIKNLPESIIGKTCLRTYPQELTGRHFPSTQKYEVHLAGIPLSIKTLAFQEQDRVVAACATSALWSIFQGTGKLFHHSVPSPYQITKKATLDFPTNTRVFPNNGLTLEMMSKAINSIGLEPLLINAKNEDITKAAIYAYLKSKIPVLMGFDLQNIELKNHLGKHAVAITGYNLEPTAQASRFKMYPESKADLGLILKSSRISKLYAHDDQVGPFARMNFGEQTKIFCGYDETGKEKFYDRWCMSTSWGMQNKINKFFALPDAILIPTYNKIRIPFESVLVQLYEFNHKLLAYAMGAKDKASQELFSQIEWDIHLTNINDFKYEIIHEPQLSSAEKLRINSSRYPRFMWRIIAMIGEHKLIELLVDATDIEQNEYIVDFISYVPIISEIFKNFSLLYYNERCISYTDNKFIKYLSAIKVIDK